MEEESGSPKPHWYTVEVSVQGFLSIDSNGRKTYTKGFTRDWVVDSDSLSMEFLIRSLSSEMTWGTNQKVVFWVHDKRSGEDIELYTDAQIADIIDMYKPEKHFMLIASVFDKDICKHNEVFEPICVVPPDVPTTNNEPPCPPTMEEANSPSVSNLQEADEDEPQPQFPDVFDNHEEYVGVADEYIYGAAPTAEPESAPTDNEHSDNAQPVVADTTEPPPSRGPSVVEAEVNDADPQEIVLLHNPENPDIRQGALFSDIITFRKAIRHYAIKKGFEFARLKTDKTRFIAHCNHEGCPWRIHASRLQDDKTIQIKVLPFEHNCSTTKLFEGKMATQGWVADRLGDWVKNNPDKGAKAAKEKLEEQYEVKLKYSKAWSGFKLALQQVHGTYEESFQLLFNWAAEVENVCPGSILEIDVNKVGKKRRFQRMFVAFKPCIDGFLNGCRPYVGVDATRLVGKYSGQLASATAVDGHNWLFYVAFAIFDSETDENWIWFMNLLQKAIGNPQGLVISSDACKGLANAIALAFPGAEHRECMRHLYANFMKRYRGPVFTEHLYPAARSYTEDRFRWHMQQISNTSPEAIAWLDKNHSRIWYRCGFSEECKCDYLTNNVSESFNKQIKSLRGLLLHEVVDGLRGMIMEKMAARRKIGRMMDDGILPSVIMELNKASNNLRLVKVGRCDDDFAEVTLVDADNVTRRHTVDLQNHKCSCRKWQVTGQPCNHALAWICANRGRIADYVHDFYSVQRFRAAYAGMVPPMRDRTQWPAVDLGYKLYPPRQKRAAGRPRVQRFRGVLEPGRRTVRCKRCGGMGHFQKTCKLADASDEDSSDEYVSSDSTPNKRKRKGNTDNEDQQQAGKKKKNSKNRKCKVVTADEGVTHTPKKKKQAVRKKHTPKKKKALTASSAPPAKVIKKGCRLPQGQTGGPDAMVSCMSYFVDLM